MYHDEVQGLYRNTRQSPTHYSPYMLLTTRGTHHKLLHANLILIKTVLVTFFRKNKMFISWHDRTSNKLSLNKNQNSTNVSRTKLSTKGARSWSSVTSFTEEEKESYYMLREDFPHSNQYCEKAAGTWCQVDSNFLSNATNSSSAILWRGRCIRWPTTGKDIKEQSFDSLLTYSLKEVGASQPFR